MKPYLLAAGLALWLAPSALADEQAAARAQCVAVSEAIILKDESVPPDQVAALTTLVASMCDCMTVKIAAMGDDGQKILRVMTKTTVAEAEQGASDPAADRRISVRILMQEFGMSEGDANAFYDRTNPQVEAIGTQCAAEASEGLQ